MVTITNNFHDTRVRLRARPGSFVSAGQVARARAKLCGVTGCTCSNYAGMRGPQPDGVWIEFEHRHGKMTGGWLRAHG